MNDATDLNWLHPGQRIRSLVDRSTIPGANIPDFAITSGEEIYTIAAVEEHPEIPGWFGITLREHAHNHVYSLRDPQGLDEQDLRRLGSSAFPLLWEPVE